MYACRSQTEDTTSGKDSMTVETAQFASSSAPWQAVPALVVADGTVAHPAYRALLAPTAPLRDVIDAIHAICLLHGRHPRSEEHTSELQSLMRSSYAVLYLK